MCPALYKSILNCERINPEASNSIKLSFASLIQSLLSCSNDAESCWLDLVGASVSLGKVCLKASWVSLNRASLCAIYRCRLLALYFSSLFASAWGSWSTPSHLRLRSVAYPCAGSPLPLLRFAVSESLLLRSWSHFPFFLLGALSLGSRSWD